MPPHLIMLAPAPVIRLPDGQLRLDVKYVEGMRPIATPGLARCLG